MMRLNNRQRREASLRDSVITQRIRRQARLRDQSQVTGVSIFRGGKGAKVGRARNSETSIDQRSMVGKTDSIDEKKT